MFRVTPRSRNVKLTKRNGVLFSNPGIWGKSLFYFGTLLLVASLSYAVYLYWPLGTAVVNYWRYRYGPKIAIFPPKIPIVATPTPQLPKVTDEYSVSIPKINASAKIVVNVSPFDSEDYLKVLKENVVAQAIDTSEINMGPGHSTFIFAHSTQQGAVVVRNNSIFYLLGELTNSDVIYINRFGTIYTYRVFEQKIVNANQIEYLTYTEPDKEILILQTCWPIGTDWKRLLVFAQRVK